MKYLVLLRQFVLRFNRLSKRDKLAVFGAGLALIIGAEFEFVVPQHTRRVALQEQQDPKVHQDQQSALKALQIRREALQAEWSTREKSALTLQQAMRPNELFAQLRQTLTLQGVEIQLLQALNDEVASVASSAASATDTNQAVADAEASAVVAAAASAGTAATIYKHRALLKVRGVLPNILQILDQFETEKYALQLERVVLKATDTHDVEAALTLIVFSEEPAWLGI